MAIPVPEVKSPDVSEPLIDSSPKKPAVIRFFQWLSRNYQYLLDSWTPFTFPRWAATVFLMLIYLVRVFYLKGWYIITYALGIYHLNLFIAFLSPKIDPAAHEDYDDGPELPTTVNEEFRPFIRRLPEFKFWYSATRAIFVAMFCTLFEAFNIPVFWPILLLYFCLLFCVTMKRQIKDAIRTSKTLIDRFRKSETGQSVSYWCKWHPFRHMIKYRYLPWTTGKTTYKGKEDTGKIVSA